MNRSKKRFIIFSIISHDRWISYQKSSHNTLANFRQLKKRGEPHLLQTRIYIKMKVIEWKSPMKRQKVNLINRVLKFAYKIINPINLMEYHIIQIWRSLMDLIKPMPGCFSIPTFHFCWFSVNPSFGEISETTTKYNVFKRPWQTQFHFFFKTWLVCSQGFIKLKKKEKDVKDHTWQSKKDTDQLIEQPL